MALAHISVLEGRGTEEKRGLVDAIGRALSEALHAPAEDPSVRLIEYPSSHVLIPYPDRHSDRYTTVEVTLFAGRSIDTKRRLYRAIVAAVEPFGVPPEDVLIVLHESPMHDWGVDAGIPASEIDVGFKVDI